MTWRGQLMRIILGVVLGIAAAEGMLRLVYGGSVVHLPAYEQGGGAGIRLAPGAEAEGRMPSGQRYTVRIDERGLREPAPAAPEWLIVGDSVPFGLGVEGEEALAAALTAAGTPAANGAVPSFCVPDALAHGEALLGAGLGARGVLVVVDAADDALPVRETVTSRFSVASGRLVAAGSVSAGARALLASRLSRSLLVNELATLSGLLRARGGGDGRPRWVTEADGGEALLRDLGALIREFAARNEALTVKVAWAPLDAAVAPERPYASPYARLARGAVWDDAAAVRGLASGLGEVPLLDLSAALMGAEAPFLQGDHHLSPAGHAAAAAALRPWLAAP